MTERIPHISPSEGGVVRPIFLSIKDAAGVLGVSPWSVRRLLDESEIADTWIGGRRLVVLRSLEEYAAARLAEDVS